MLLPPNPALFGDYELLEDSMPQFESPYSRPDYNQAYPNKKEASVQVIASVIWQLISGGFLRPYRTQVIGSVTAISAIALWAVGDISFTVALGFALGGLSFLTVALKIHALAKALGVDVKLGTGFTLPQLPPPVVEGAPKPLK